MTKSQNSPLDQCQGPAHVNRHVNWMRFHFCRTRMRRFQQNLKRFITIATHIPRLRLSSEDLQKWALLTGLMWNMNKEISWSCKWILETMETSTCFQTNTHLV